MDIFSAGNLRAGLTGTTAAVSENGCLALSSAAGQPLSASLLPELWVSLLCKESIVEGLEDLFRQTEISQPASSVLICGPSRTADIEMSLTIGEHGPGELLVICY